eukprot:7741392-Lingulodinium_polyedra.AAC.1
MEAGDEPTASQLYVRQRENAAHALAWAALWAQQQPMQVPIRCHLAHHALSIIRAPKAGSNGATLDVMAWNVWCLAQQRCQLAAFSRPAGRAGRRGPWHQVASALAKADHAAGH